MFARFDENPAMTLRVIKETKRYGRTDGRTHAQTDKVKTVYPLQTKFAGGIIIVFYRADLIVQLRHLFLIGGCRYIDIIHTQRPEYLPNYCLL